MNYCNQAITQINITNLFFKNKLYADNMLINVLIDSKTRTEFLLPRGCLSPLVRECLLLRANLSPPVRETLLPRAILPTFIRESVLLRELLSSLVREYLDRRMALSPVVSVRLLPGGKLSSVCGGDKTATNMGN